jgi:antitoxin component YwqK of YwqJK toxin-antitoxin module
MLKFSFLFFFLTIVSYGQDATTTIKMRFSSNVKTVSIKDGCSPENDGNSYHFNREGLLTEEILRGADDSRSYRIIYTYNGSQLSSIEHYTDNELVLIEKYEYSDGRLVRYTEGGGDAIPIEALYEYEGSKLRFAITDYNGDITEAEHTTTGHINAPGGLTTIVKTTSREGEYLERIQNDGAVMTYEVSTTGEPGYRLSRIEAYDDMGRLMEVTHTGDEYGGDTKRVFEYDGEVLVHEEEYEDGELTAEIFYDIYGNMIMETNDTGGYTEYNNRYNEHGDLVEVRAVADGEELCAVVYDYEYWPAK